ncbi:MAG: ScyD/ScyE family protein [Chloroflexota bacterium]|nr:ScyD/ScyE family protein [Chloroflexota bacterium]
MKIKRWFAVATILTMGQFGPLTTASATQDAPATPANSSTGTVEVVASGLVNPRGFAFGPNNELIVALGGTGGETAGIVVAGDDTCPKSLLDGVRSTRVAFAAYSGVADVAFHEGELYALVSGGNIDGDALANGLYEVETDGQLTLRADISGFIRDNPVTDVPGDYDTDGQPYALRPVDDGFLVTEGNSNQLLHVSLDGSIRRIADLSAGHPIPTGLTVGPEGEIYVGFLTPAPYPEGAASVVRIGPDGARTEVWSGLSLITALALGPDGALYALELATGHGDDPNAIAPGTGRVVRQTGPAEAEPVVTGLNLPTAMRFAPDGSLFIGGPTVGADDGQGTIIRVVFSGTDAVAVPEVLAVPTCD